MIDFLRNNIVVFFTRYKTDAAYRGLLQASISSFFIRGGGMFFGFLVTLITSRFYGADALGVVSVCFAILSLAAVIGKLGMDIALVRYISEYLMGKRFGAIKNIYLKAWSVIRSPTSNRAAARA
jgi:O-antigen/teichoic acid export membrane protein